MADRVRKVNYCHVTVPGRTGSGAKVLGALRDAGVNMVGFSGFPSGAGRAQLDFVVEGVAGVRRVGAKNGWRVSPAKKAFLVQGQDRPGAVHAILRRLADTGVSVTAAEGVASGRGRYGMIVWVKPKDYGRAAKALKAG